MTKNVKEKIPGILILLAFAGFVAFSIHSCKADAESRGRVLQSDDYVRIIKKMDYGDGKIAVVQYGGWRNYYATVRYIKDVKYLNPEKTKWAIIYSDNTEYMREYLKFIPKEKIVEKNGIFKEK